MRILITGNMGYVGPVLVRHFRDRFPEDRLTGFDAGFFAHCLTTAGPLPETPIIPGQRQELNPIEEALAYKRLIDTLGLVQEEIAERVGKSRSIVATSMRLLRLPGEVQRELVEGRLSAGHGRALLMTDDPDVQRTVAQDIIDRGLSVRETEKAVKRVRRAGKTVGNKEVTASLDPNVRAAETKLMRRLNTNVKISPAKKGAGGRIEIEYYGTDDLDRIYELLMNKE